jgi:hypothetical protein
MSRGSQGRDQARGGTKRGRWISTWRASRRTTAGVRAFATDIVVIAEGDGRLIVSSRRIGAVGSTQILTIRTFS